MGTASPTVPLTESPTWVPTISPTESPTETPSKAPTKVSLQCSDGGSFYVSSKVAPRTCEWLASSTSNQKNCAKWFNWGKYDGKTYGAPGFICRRHVLNVTLVTNIT